MLYNQRFGEDGRRFPDKTEAVWDGFMELARSGRIKPVIYKEKYTGLGDISRALKDLQNRRTWGRAIVTINEQAEIEKSRL